MYLICDELILSQNFDTMQSDVMTPNCKYHTNINLYIFRRYAS